MKHRKSNHSIRAILLVMATGPIIVLQARAQQSEQVDAVKKRLIHRPQDQSADRRAQVANAALNLRASTVQTPQPIRYLHGRIEVDLELDGTTRTLQLDPVSVRGDGFSVFLSNGDDDLTTIAIPPAPIYAGQVRGLVDSHVRASLNAGQLQAVVYFHNDQCGIQPLPSTDPDDLPSEHVVFRASDVIGHGRTCAVSQFAHADDASSTAAPYSDSSTSGTDVKIVDLAIDADYEFFASHGSDVAATVHDIEGIINALRPIYEVPEIGITYELSTIVVRTQPGTYNGSDALDLLCQFRNRWNTPPESSIHRDIAHLFTGKELIGSTIGIAFVGVVCNVVANSPDCGSSGNVAYGLSQSRFSQVFTTRVALTAHELGHNWGANHCSGSGCNIMCPVIDCPPNPPCSCNMQAFAAGSAGIIRNYRNTRTCLLDKAPPLNLPFTEEFDFAGTPNPTRWSYNDGGNVTTVPDATVPSPPFALELSTAAASANEFDRDEIRSQRIDLTSLFGSTLFISALHRGVTADQALVVEFWSADGQWTLLDRWVSDGVDRNEFARHTIPLPTNALHGEFRLKFRAEVQAASQRWFLDDITIQTCPPHGDLNDDGIVNLLDIICAIDGLHDAGPTCGIKPIDLWPCGGNGTINLLDILSVLRAAGGTPDCPTECHP